MSFDFKLPDLGEGIHEAEILSIKVSEGQIITEDLPLFEVETDKAVVEIPSPVAGKVAKIHVQSGQIVSVGSVMISIEENSSKKSNIGLPQSSESAREKISTASNSEKARASSTSEIIATPATRQLARELKIDIHLVHGTASGGKISKEDVLAYANSQKEKADLEVANVAKNYILPDFQKLGPIERIPMRSIRRKTAQSMR